jgi:alpha-tubulin suppressor-like RCC1 family protein
MNTFPRALLRLTLLLLLHPVAASANEGLFAGGFGTCQSSRKGALDCWGEPPRSLTTAPPQGGVRSLVFDRRMYCAADLKGRLTCADDLSRPGNVSGEGVARVLSVSTGYVSWQRTDGQFCLQSQGEEARCTAIPPAQASKKARPPEVLRVTDDGVWLSDGRQCRTPMYLSAAGCEPMRLGDTAAGPLRAVTERCVLDAKGRVWCLQSFAMPPTGEESQQERGYVRVPGLDGGDGLLDVGGHVCSWKRKGRMQCVSDARRDGEGRLSAAKPVEGLACVSQAAAGLEHACARTCDGGTRCFLSNERGQLGLPVIRERAVVKLQEVRSLSAGTDHTCAVHGEGRVSCWGRNSRGELAAPEEVRVDSSPRSVPLPGPAREVSAGDRSSCALLQDGAVACWGDNTGGAVKPGAKSSPAATAAPVRVLEELGKVEQVRVSFWHGCARPASGALRCWGSNHLGQLGAGHLEPVDGIAQVEGATDVVDFDVHSARTCAVRKDGRVVCWGDLRSRTGERSTVRPELVEGVEDAVDVAVGDGHACARTRMGKVFCWQGLQEPAQEVPKLSDVVAIDTTEGTREGDCAVRKDGTVWCWGASELPFPSRTKRGVWQVPGLAGVSAFVLGEAHGCALHTEGGVTCIGDRNPAVGGGDVLYIEEAVARP